jgi:histidyl-tRNA synthetase
MSDKLTAVKGMNDVLPEHAGAWEALEAQVRDMMQRYGYANVRTPVVEPTALFVRGLGEVTDIVEKEMYSFEDRLNGEYLTLRPEGTAGVVRAAVQHHMLRQGGQRLYYMGPMFRHERPQRGRYRQFHQIGVEVLGHPGPDVDGEIILLAADLWQALGLQGITLQINSLGQPEERRAHRQALVTYLEQHRSVLDEDAARRLHTNPLRVLDSKNPAMQPLIEGAPQLISYLGEASRQHLDAVRAVLQANGVAHQINPRLVRGMDYYNLTVFEFVTDALGAQGTVCAGGRYDGLMQQLGGKPAPGVGWALGVERILELLREQGQSAAAAALDVYAVVATPDAAQVAQACRVLRRAGARVRMHAASTEGQGSIKSQFKRADASGAAWAMVLGEDELARGVVAMKALRDGQFNSQRNGQHAAQQREVPIAELDAWWRAQHPA